jgi:hypothetical protein
LNSCIETVGQKPKLKQKSLNGREVSILKRPNFLGQMFSNQTTFDEILKMTEKSIRIITAGHPAPTQGPCKFLVMSEKIQRSMDSFYHVVTFIFCYQKQR